ncbi:AraC family transcriptional regulator [Dasania marina]|uniref:AraC family transcriptional regulator n=1 Tax=Dasania marina TaxID=471499 RepID=UPI00036F7CE1|nr:AraC family transcriptional regulator [Dasania marina]
MMRNSSFSSGVIAVATTSAFYAKTSYLGAKLKGVDTDKLLAEVGLNAEQIQQPGARVNVIQMTRLIQLIWAELQDEFMGFTLHRCKTGTYAMKCQMVSHCENLNSLFEQGVKFYSLVTDDIIMAYEQTDEGMEFSIRMADPSLDPNHFYLEFWLMLWHRFASWMIGKKIKLKKVYFNYPAPEHVADFDIQFSCECVFKAPVTKCVFPSHYGTMPLVRTQREIAHFLKDAPAGIMVMPGEDDSTGLKVKTFLLDSFEKDHVFPDFEAVASYLNNSPQALRRHLKEEGSSYQKIKDVIRRDLAIERICVQNMAVHKVASYLGFTEPRSFTRAFKQWTGLSPKRYKHRNK